MSDEAIARLMNMGFEFDHIVNALEASNNDEQLAISFLTAQNTPQHTMTYPNANRPSVKKKKIKKKKKDIITWEDGRRRIYEEGIKPFFNRIESVFNNKIFNKGSINAQGQFVLCYDCIFDLCIQRDPNNYTKQCYELHISSLKEYFNDIIKLQLNALKNRNIIGIDKDIKYFMDFIEIYKKCKIVMDGLNRFFLYLNRFYVPNNEGIMTLEGHSLLTFYKDIFHVHSKYLIKVLFKCINICREHKLCLLLESNCNDNDYYKIKQLIKICVNIIANMDNGLNNDEIKTKTKLIRNCKLKILREKDELFVKGFLREMSDNMAEFNTIVPLDINAMIISYYGEADIKSIYDEYFWSIFRIESMEYYDKKCIEIYNYCNKLSDYIQFTQKCIQYEMDQITQCTENQMGVRNDTNAQFIHSICNKLYDQQLENQYLLNLCQINHKYISVNEIKKHFIDIYKSLQLLNTNELQTSLVYKATRESTYELVPAVDNVLRQLFNKYSDNNHFMHSEHFQTFMFSLLSGKNVNTSKVEEIMQRYGKTSGADNIYSMTQSEFISYYKTECVLRPNIVWNDLMTCGYDLRETKTSKMFQMIVENAKNDIRVLFNRYIEMGKVNRWSKDIYKKYQLIYDSIEVYKLFVKYNDSFEVSDNKYLDMKYNKMINKMFLEFIIELICGEYKYIIDLLNRFTNFILRNCYSITDIDDLIGYIGFIYNELLVYARPTITNKEFENRYKYLLKKRLKCKMYLSTKKQHKLLYFEKKMIDKLNNLCLKQFVGCVVLKK